MTYATWRDLFWLQSALCGVAMVGSFLLLPETIYHRKIDDLVGYPAHEKARVLWRMINPVRVIRLYRYPNLVLTAVASSSLLLNMYGLLTPIQYVLNPRFHLDSPLQGGLFYLAPGCGYLVGTFGGGRYADYTVRKWMKKRDGVRVPEDRLRSAIPFMGGVIPACILVYGWAVDKDVGGIPLVVIVLFVQGVAQLFCFPSLNTYCLDVMPGKGSEVIAGNYFVRYLFACMGTAVVLPAIDGIGVGWFSTICTLFLLFGSACGVVTIWKGREMREAVDRKRKAKRMREGGRAREEQQQQQQAAHRREEKEQRARQHEYEKDHEEDSPVVSPEHVDEKPVLAPDVVNGNVVAALGGKGDGTLLSATEHEKETTTP